MAQGAIAAIRYYPYHGIGTALDDLEAGNIGLVIKLFPVISWLTRERSNLSVVMQMPTHERLGIAYAPDRADLCDAVDAAIEALRLCRHQLAQQIEHGVAVGASGIDCLEIDVKHASPPSRMRVKA